jgi:hypothetical protein
MPQNQFDLMAYLLNRNIEHTLYIPPHPHTVVGLFPRCQTSQEQMNADLMLSFRCHYMTAFSRVLLIP